MPNGMDRNGNYSIENDWRSISSADFIPWDSLKGKRLFVTGATGLIGFNLIGSLLYLNKEKGLSLTITALVRDIKRARERLGQFMAESEDVLKFVEGNVEILPEIEEDIDLVIHGASETSSRAFVDRPIETQFTAVNGTESMLRLAHSKHVEGFVYLSSMEVYGTPQKGHRVREDEAGSFSPLVVRNSYPISKQMCESLCCAFHHECGVPARIIRLTQTFGPGVEYDDGRIFAEFARCAIEKRDIVLKTRGETERSYLYTADAVTAILTVLLKGESGMAYNAANEKTYCSIAQMARSVAADNGISIEYAEKTDNSDGYAPVLYMDLDTDRLESLGWRISTEKPTLESMYRSMIGWIKEQKDAK